MSQQDYLKQVLYDTQGYVIVPDDFESLIYHTISKMGSLAIKECAHKSLDFKYAYILGYCRAVENNR